MSDLNCKHCDGEVFAEETECSHCGIPLPPNHATERQRHFRVWFIAVVIFCFFMMFWLPPNWTPFLGE